MASGHCNTNRLTQTDRLTDPDRQTDLDRLKDRQTGKQMVVALKSAFGYSKRRR